MVSGWEKGPCRTYTSKDLAGVVAARCFALPMRMSRLRVSDGHTMCVSKARAARWANNSRNNRLETFILTFIPPVPKCGHKRQEVELVRRTEIIAIP